MKKHLKVVAVVASSLVVGCGTASAYSADTNSVVLNMDGVPRMVTTDKETVGELMEDLSKTMNVTYVATDAQEGDLIADNMELTLTAVTEKVVSTTQTVPYETIERNNDQLESGVRRVVQQGVNGTKTVTSKEIYEGKELIDTVVVEETIVTEPVDEIIEIGTKKEVVATTTQSNTIAGYSYSKAIQVKATAYTPYDPGCTGITATGIPAKKGVVAVDPSVIPLGSKVYVPGYGVAVAADTGGAIKGNRLDVCYESVSQAYTWGVKYVTVYVLN